MFRPIKLLRTYSKLFQSCLLNNHIGEKLSLRPEEAFSNNQEEAGGTDCKPAVLPESSPRWPSEKPHLCVASTCTSSFLPKPVCT